MWPDHILCLKLLCKYMLYTIHHSGKSDMKSGGSLNRKYTCWWETLQFEVALRINCETLYQSL